MHVESHRATASTHGFRDYLDAVARLPVLDARPLALRLHIPDLDDRPAGGAALGSYLSYLKREAAMHAALFAGTSIVRQLSFDGPAAAMLSDQQFDGLLAHLHEHFRFMPGDTGDYEVTLAPAGLCGARLARLRGQGFNRLRIECLDPDIGHNRLRALAGAARHAGFHSICVRLAYGMPGQDFASLRRMLEATLAAEPEHVLLCHLPGPGHGEADIPPGGVAQRMQHLCCDRLDMAGYTQTGAGQFARPPDDTAQAQGATRLLPVSGIHLVGCGTGAFGSVGAVVRQNAESLRDYCALLDRNTLPVMRVLRRMRDEQTRPYLMQVKDFRDADQ